MTRLLTAGSINTDLVVSVERAPEAGETVTGSAFGVFGGGKGANQTVAAARSGAAVSMLGAIGDDDFGRQRLADLTRDKVDVSGIAVIPDAPSGVALITLEEQGENRIAYVPGATMQITPEHALAVLSSVQPTTILATLELPPAALSQLFDGARALGATIVLNATPEPGAHRELVERADILIVNETETRELLGWNAHQSDWEAAAVRLAALGPVSIVITLGAEGALVSTEAGIRLISPPKVAVVDTTGAGDAFCGAFAAALTSGSTVEEAAEIGVVAGALAVTKMGAQPSQPTRDEIRLLMSQRS
jgi:ribokinase